MKYRNHPFWLQMLLLAPYGIAKPHWCGRRVVYRLILARLIGAHPHWPVYRQTKAGMQELERLLKYGKRRATCCSKCGSRRLAPAAAQNRYAPYLKILDHFKMLLDLIDAIPPTLVSERAWRAARTFAWQRMTYYESMAVIGRLVASDRKQKRRKRAK